MLNKSWASQDNCHSYIKSLTHISSHIHNVSVDFFCDLRPYFYGFNLQKLFLLTFFIYSTKIESYIEDDHIPFMKRGVPIVHAIVSPFPDVWHKLTDDESAIDYQSVSDLLKVFGFFAAEYLHLSV